MNCNTVESYHDFLTLMESNEFNDSIISLETSTDSKASSLQYIDHSESGSQLKLNLNVNIITFYDQLTGLIDHTYPDCSENCSAPKRYDFSKPNISIKNKCLSKSAYSDPSCLPTASPVENQSTLLPYCNETSCSDDEIDRLSIYSYEFCKEDEKLDIHSGSQKNPIAPNLFPKMDINDNKKFMKFDTLPLNPSYVSR